MYHFIEYNRSTGDITGYFKSSTKEFLPKAATPEHEHIEVVDAKHVELLQKLTPFSGRPQGEIKSGKLKSLTVPARPALHLKSKKVELIGDGSDKTTIEIQAVDATGKPVSSIDDDIRVTTDRGKLSVRGGLLKLKQGHAKIELTSVKETVRKVRIRAESLTGSAAAGDLTLEFV